LRPMAIASEMIGQASAHESPNIPWKASTKDLP
jgi:hypothetical protein